MSVRRRRPAQVLQPARRHQGIAVQQHHVVPGGGTHAVVRTGREAAVAPVADQRDAPLARQSIQRRGQIRLRRGIIDHDQPARAAQACQHAVEAGECMTGAAVHGDHHVDQRAAVATRRASRRTHRATGIAAGAIGRGRAGAGQPDRAGPASPPRRRRLPLARDRAGCPAGPCRRGPAHAAVRSARATPPAAR